MKTFVMLTTFACLSAAAVASPETYVLDGTHTLPRFEYNHMGFSTQSSRFDKASGSITLDRVAHVGSVDIAIDVRSIDTGTALLNANIQGEELLDAAKYPAITFKSRSFAFRGDDVASVAGELTIKGITRPVTLNVESFACKPHPRLKVEACGAVATATIKRSDFRITGFLPLVSDELVLVIPVEAIKQ